MQEFKIESVKNNKIKFIQKLNQKKFRNKFESFFVENFKIVQEGIISNNCFEEIFITNDFLNKTQNKLNLIFNKNNKIRQKNNFSKLEKINIITNKINKSFSKLSTPSGIVAVFKKRKCEINNKKPIIYLNNISDPGNLGTILRSASAFGFKNIIIDEFSADLYNNKTLNAAKDSIFKLNIIFDKNIKLLKSFKGKTPIISTCLKNSTNIKILKKYKVFCLVLGNEANGVSESIQNLSDKSIKIPMTGNQESLNVAIAGAIIFYTYYV